MSVLSNPARRGRGVYDRTVTPAERRDAVRVRLLEATAQVLLDEQHPTPNVANVVASAGTGRNTFYELFADGRAARRAAQRHAADELAVALDSAVRAAHTPIERVRALASAWADHAVSNLPLARLVWLATGVRPPPCEAVLGARLDQLIDEARAQGVLPASSGVRCEWVAGAWWRAAVDVNRRQLLASEAARDLVDLTLRMNR